MNINTKPEFYIKSTEGYEDFSFPRACYPIKRLKGEKRDDYLLIAVEPPIIGQKYGLGDKDIDFLIIATRHADTSLFPVSEWPLYVHIAYPLIENVEFISSILLKDIKLIAWGELYQTKECSIK